MREAVHVENPVLPTAVWVRTRKGRGYGKYDYKSHGSPHGMNSPEYWETKREFADRYGVKFEGFGEPAPKEPVALREQVRTNLQRAISVLREDGALVEYLSDRLVEIGDSVPEEHPRFRYRAGGAGGSAAGGGAAASTAGAAAAARADAAPFEDDRLYDFRSYPTSMWAAPGSKQPNRAALAKWGAWANAW